MSCAAYHCQTGALSHWPEQRTELYTSINPLFHRQFCIIYVTRENIIYKLLHKFINSSTLAHITFCDHILMTTSVIINDISHQYV